MFTSDGTVPDHVGTLFNIAPLLPRAAVVPEQPSGSLSEGAILLRGATLKSVCVLVVFLELSFDFLLRLCANWGCVGVRFARLQTLLPVDAVCIAEGVWPHPFGAVPFFNHIKGSRHRAYSAVIRIKLRIL